MQETCSTSYSGKRVKPFSRFASIILTAYGENAEVGFDGYPVEPTTKDTTHLKCTKGKKGRLVKFALNSKMSLSKEKFLLNKVNKQEFLQHLTEYINCHGIRSVQSYADADIPIATTAVEWVIVEM